MTWTPITPTNLELADAAGYEAFTTAVTAGLGYEIAITEGLAAYCAEFDACRDSDQRRENAAHFYGVAYYEQD